MMAGPIDRSQQAAAKVAGLAYLITFAIVTYVNFGIHRHLVVWGNAAETARNILAHEQLYRIGIAGDLFYCVGVVVLLTALYVVLKPVNRGLAMLAAFWTLVWSLMWLAMTLNLFGALRIFRSAGSLGAADAERLQASAMVLLDSRFDYYYVGLLFGALGSTVCGCLWFSSRYIPRALAAFGVISSAFCAACTFIFHIYPDFDKTVNLWWFDTPMGIFDITLSFWLLFRGLRPSGVAVGRVSADAV